MNKILRYKTVLEHTEIEIIEKKSRFIANVSPIESDKEALEFINDISKKYYNATHNVYAFQFGFNNEIQRFSDDGEPSGTAGMPTLDVLRKEDIKNTVIVVTRYFGGTLLGTGGLVRAYGHAAKEGVINSKIVEKILYTKFSVKTDYHTSGKLQYAILHNEYTIHDIIYTTDVEFIILVETPLCSQFQKLVTETTNGTGDITVLGELYGTWINKELFIN